VTTTKLSSPSCFFFCYNEEGDDNFVAVAFCFFFCCNKEGNGSFIVVTFLFSILLQRRRRQLAAKLLLPSFVFILLQRRRQQLAKLPLPSFFGFVATKKETTIKHCLLLWFYYSEKEDDNFRHLV